MLGNVKTGASLKTGLATTECYHKHTKSGSKYACGPSDHHLSTPDHEMEKFQGISKYPFIIGCCAWFREEK
jgi:hypothetical protein